MTPRISARIAAIAESATLAVDAKAKALKAAGRPVIGFGAGEPDFPTPDYIVEAAAAATKVVANHRYTPTPGLPDLREAIVAKTKRDSNYDITVDQVLVTNGGKQSVYQAFATIIDPGDEVLLPSPYWTTYPEAIKKPALIYGDFLTTKSVADQLAATMKAVGGYGEPSMITYNPAGEANWTPFAQKLKSDGITFMSFVGTDSNLVLLYKAMREVGYVPEVVLNDANFYSSMMVAEGNAVANEGFLARTMYAPFEEADNFPGMASYLDMMATYNPEGRVAGLGLQATSALLMFATAANSCLDVNNNILERECVLGEAMKISSWTGGGLHSETNPAAKTAPKCGIIMGVKGGQWTRIYPEIVSADDNGGGWHCDDNGAVTIEGDFGDVTAGVDPTRPN